MSHLTGKYIRHIFPVKEPYIRIEIRPCNFIAIYFLSTTLYITKATLSVLTTFLICSTAKENSMDLGTQDTGLKDE